MAWAMNRPPRWLARALAIVTGNTQLEIDERMFPTVEAAQDGWGLAVYEQRSDTIAVGVPLTVTLDAAEGEILALRVTLTNAGSANILLNIRQGISPLVVITEFIGNVAPATTAAHVVVRPDGGWLKGVPNGRWEITCGAATTNPGVLSLLIARLPAGCKQDS